VNDESVEVSLQDKGYWGYTSTGVTPTSIVTWLPLYLWDEARKRAAARAVQILNLTERASESSTVLGRTQTIVEWLHN